MADYDTLPINPLFEIPALRRGAMQDSSPYVAAPEHQEALGFPGELVDVRRAMLAGPVASRVPVRQVVHQHHDDVAPAEHGVEAEGEEGEEAAEAEAQDRATLLAEARERTEFALDLHPDDDARAPLVAGLVASAGAGSIPRDTVGVGELAQAQLVESPARRFVELVALGAAGAEDGDLHRSHLSGEGPVEEPGHGGHGHHQHHEAVARQVVAVAQDHLGYAHAVDHGNCDLVALVPATPESRLRHLDPGVDDGELRFT